MGGCLALGLGLGALVYLHLKKKKRTRTTSHHSQAEVKVDLVPILADQSGPPGDLKVRPEEEEEAEEAEAEDEEEDLTTSTVPDLAFLCRNDEPSGVRQCVLCMERSPRWVLGCGHIF